MAALVEHLLLNLMEEKDQSFLLDVPISPKGLLRHAGNTVIYRYQEVKWQSAAFKEFIPRGSEKLKP